MKRKRERRAAFACLLLNVIFWSGFVLTWISGSQP